MQIIQDVIMKLSHICSTEFCQAVNLTGRCTARCHQPAAVPEGQIPAIIRRPPPPFHWLSGSPIFDGG